MLRLTTSALGRPCGPLGVKLAGDLRLTDTYRSEVVMVRNTYSSHFNANVRDRFKQGQSISNMYAIPRDLGELPRNHVLKTLQRNEPITIDRLFDILKEKPNCPVDSRKHMRQVLRIARLQSWVYVEKNQTDNRWYFYIHPQKRGAVQELLRQEREAEKDMDRSQNEKAALRIADAEVSRSAALDATIVALQKDLISNVAKIREYEPEFASELPCSTPSGAVNVVWHRAGKQAAAEE